MDSVRVVVADDHPLFRQALASTVATQERFDLVGEAASGPTALRLIEEHAPDVALLDLRMPELSGMDVLRALPSVGSTTRAMLLSAEVTGAVVHEALTLGAAGFLAKTESPSEVLAAIDSAHRGEVVVSSRLQSGLFGEIADRGAGGHRVITPREREILSLAAQGASGTVIGKTLHISPATVKTHIQRACEKLGVNDRTSAVAEALRRGLIR